MDTHAPSQDRRGRFKLPFRKRRSRLAWIVFPTIAGCGFIYLWTKPDSRGFWKFLAALLLAVGVMWEFVKNGSVIIGGKSFIFDHFPDLVIEVPYATVEVLVETAHDLSILFNHPTDLKTVRFERTDFPDQHWNWIVAELSGKIRKQAPTAKISLLQPDLPPS